VVVPVADSCFFLVVLSAVLHLAFMCTCCVLQRQPICVHWTIFGCYFPGQLVVSCVVHVFVRYHNDQDYARSDCFMKYHFSFGSTQPVLSVIQESYQSILVYRFCECIWIVEFVH
jgi:hypothetical protein